MAGTSSRIPIGVEDTDDICLFCADCDQPIKIASTRMWLARQIFETGPRAVAPLALRLERGSWAANYEVSPAQHPKSLRCQFREKYDVKKVRNTSGTNANWPTAAKPLTFRSLKTLEDFEWNFNPSINRKQIYQWATGNFMRERCRSQQSD